MREISSTRRGKIHSHLESDTVQKAFIQNKEDEKYSSKSAYNDGDSDKENSIKWTLKQIYYNKCAFCESDITNDFGDIEHFRPKNGNEDKIKKCVNTYSYYWLAFSWDNLLPSCSRCNGKKTNCFDIGGDRATYDTSDNLENLHYKTEEYNKQEVPKLLHPEYDTFEHKISFDDKGKICSEDERVLYTIKICDLNRPLLSKDRQDIIVDFINDLQEHIVSFETHYNEENFDMCLEYFKTTIANFIKHSNKQYPYSLIRKYVKDNFEDFINNLDIKSKDEEFSKEIILVAFESYSK